MVKKLLNILLSLIVTVVSFGTFTDFSVNAEITVNSYIRDGEEIDCSSSTVWIIDSAPEGPKKIKLNDKYTLYYDGSSSEANLYAFDLWPADEYEDPYEIVVSSASDGQPAGIKITGGSGTEEDPYTLGVVFDVSGITLPGTLQVVTGETKPLTPVLAPADTFPEVTWTSSNMAVATVDGNGTVTGISKGVTTITATATNGTDDTSDDKTAVCEVSVADIFGITLQPDRTSVTVGKSFAISAVTDPAERAVVWGADTGQSGGEVALYSDEGCTKPVSADSSYTGTVYAKGVNPGTATITASGAADSSVSASMTVIIYAIENVPVESVTVTPQSLEMNANGAGETLTATVSPAHATNPNIVWSSSNNDVATVSQDGIVTPVAKGETIITVTATNGTDTEDDDKQTTCTVKVNPPAYTITAAVSPESSGTVTTEPVEKAMAGETVKLKAVPAEGYQFVSWDVKNEKGEPVAVSGNAFTMPASGMTVTAVFQKIETYNIWVQGIPVTSVNKDNVLGDIGDPTVVFNPENNTLTLNHANISGSEIGIRAKRRLTIIKGSGTVQGTDKGILIEGSVYNELIFRDATIDVTGSNSDGIIAQLIRIDGGTITAKTENSNACAIAGRTGLTYDDGFMEVIKPENGDVRKHTGYFRVLNADGTVATEAVIGPKTSFDVTVRKTSNGSVTANPAKAEPETSVTLTVSPDEGYKLKSLTVTYYDDNTVPTNPVEGDPAKYVFTMPASDVDVSASFEEIVKKYDLWVNGIRVNSENASDILGNKTAQFDAETNILTLNGANITDAGEKKAGIYSALDSLIITGSNTSTISIADEEKRAIHAEGNLTLNADITAAGNDYGIYSGKILTIAGGTITAGGETGIYGYNKIEINGGTVSSTGTDDNGINTPNDLVISGGNVTAHGSDEGIYAGENITIAGGTIITASGNNEAIQGTVKNSIAGTGWTDVEGSAGQADIAINENGQDLSKYKKVQFPAVSPVTEYNVTVSPAENGSVTADQTSAESGTIITLTVTPESGYELDSLTVTPAEGDSISPEKMADTTYTFVMPESDVTVSAEFVETRMEYNLWVAGNQVTALNKDNILGDGTASYDPLTKTLTLNGATITDTNNKRSGIYSMLDSLTITGSGTNTVTGSVNGIFALGSLNLNGSVDATGGDNGIYAENEIIIGENANVKAVGTGSRTDEDGHGEGIYSYDSSVTVNGGTVNATGSNYGIMGENAVINGGSVTAHGSQLDGIYADTVQINGGDIHSTSEAGFGIGAISDISINYATVTAETRKPNGYAIACIDYAIGTITLGSAAYIHDPYPGAVIGETARDGVSAYIALSEEDDTPAAKVVIRPVGVEAYKLWVNGKQVTAYNAADILGDGTASYNAADNTLTLTNAVIKQSGNQKAAVYSELDSLTILGNGTNTIDGSSQAKDGIYSTGSLTLSGTLKALGKDYGVYTGGNLTVSEESSVVSEGNHTGLYSKGNITIDGGNTKVTGGFFYGIYATGNISVNGGRTSSKSSGLASNAVVSDTGTITKADSLVIKKPENGIIVSTDTFDYIGNSDGGYTKEALIEPDGDHVHTFAFSAEGGTITATCTSEVCPNKGVDGTPYSEHMTIYKPDHAIYGDGKSAAATIEGSITGVDKPDIVYRKGTETLNAAPVDAGNYTASITVEGATASVNYEITKKPVTVVSGITAQNKTYDETMDAALNTGDAVINGVLKGDDLSVSAEGAFADPNAGDNKEVTITGIVLEGEDKDNYVLAEGDHQTSATATISKAKITGATLTKYIVKLNSTDTVDVATVIADKLTVPAEAYDKTIPGDYTEEGNYSVTVTAKEKSNFVGVVTVPFHVVKEGSKTFESGIEETTFTYTGNEITPAVTVTDIDGKTLTRNVDYEVYYHDNVEVGYGKVTVTGLGEYQSKSGPQIHVFEITKAASTVTTAPKANELTYTGSAQELVTAGTAEGGTMMYALGTDASVAPAESAFTTSIPKETDAGTYYVWYKAAGDDNHNDSAPVPVSVTINKAEIKEVTLTNYVIKLNSGQTVSVKTVTAGDVTVPADAYTADIPAYTEDGSYTVTVTAKDDSNFSGSKTATFHVVEPGAKVFVSEIYETEYTYNGTAFEPTVSVVDIDNNPLVKDRDYRVEYSNNVKAGVGRVTVFGFGEYQSKNAPQVHVFTINKADIKPSVTISGWNYGETPKTPSVTGNKGDGAVTYSYKAKGDSTYSETVPTDAGTYTVKAEIAETDNYKVGTATKNFTIAKAPAPELTDDQKPTAITGLKYNGTAQRLVTAPESAPEGYTVKYSLDGKTWSASVPTGTKSGPYTIKVRYIGDSNHEDFDGEDLKTAITIDYYAYAGNNQTWQKKSEGNLEIVFKSKWNDKQTFSKWTKTVVIDGTPVSSGSFSAKEGSLVIDLKAAYLDTLAVGRHDITVEFSDGSAAAVFSITEKESSGGGSSPKKPSTPSDNVVTCQMAGYPSSYSWNEAAKACQPGYIDVTGNFRPYQSSSRTVPNTRDGGLAGYAVTFTISIITAFLCGLLLLGKKHHD